MSKASYHRRLLRRIRLPDLLTAANANVGNRTFSTPNIDNYMCEPSEPWMIDLLSRLLPERRGSFIDVGVNLGQTLLAVKAIAPDCPYLGVEPNPVCVAYVEKLKLLNALTDCSIVPVALGREIDLARLQHFRGNAVDSSASLVENFRPEERVSYVQIVPVFPFDRVAESAGITSVGLVKIDVEGAEADVIATMLRAIVQHKPWIIMEILPCYRADNHDRIRRQNEIEANCAAIDYVIQRIHRGADGRLATVAPIETIGIHSNMEWSDYILCPRADLDRLREVVSAPGRYSNAS